MARREYTRRLVCGEEGCGETQFRRYDYQRDLKDAISRDKGRPPWKCLKHVDPSKVLSPTNLEITYVSEPTEYDDRVRGFRWDGNNWVHGPGFYAWAEDFPAGSQLVVTARVVLPPDYQPPEPASGVTSELPAAPRYSGPVVDLDGAH